MKYKVGDKVKIKKREELEKCYIVVKAMLPYAEQIATITYVDDREEFYHIDDKEFNHYRWDDKCFCGKVLPDLPKELELPINVKETIIEKANETRQILEKFDALLSEFQELRDRLYDLERNK